MYAILTSAFNAVLAWVFTLARIKYVALGVVFLVVYELFQWVASLLPSLTIVCDALAYLPYGTWYFLNMVNFSQGVTIIVGAFVTRFLIRRLPVVG